MSPVLCSARSLSWHSFSVMVLFAFHIIDGNGDGAPVTYMVRDESEQAARLDALTEKGVHSLSVHLDHTKAAHKRMLELAAKFEAGEPAAGAKRPRLSPPEAWKLAEDADVQWLVDTASDWYFWESSLEEVEGGVAPSDAPEGEIATFAHKPPRGVDMWKDPKGLVKGEAGALGTKVDVYAICNSM